MRKHCLIGLTGLLLGTSLAQETQQRMEVPLHVTYTAAAVLTPDAPERELPFPVDSPVQASVSVLTSSSTLQVTLVDPGGAEHEVGNTDSVVAASYSFPVGAVPSGGQSYNFDVKNPMLGTWKVRLREADFSAPRVAILTVYNIAGVGVALVRTGRDYPVNGPISLGLIVADTLGGLPRSAISSVTASIRADGSGPTIPITFADDGAGKDGQARQERALVG